MKKNEKSRLVCRILSLETLPPCILSEQGRSTILRIVPYYTSNTVVRLPRCFLPTTITKSFHMTFTGYGTTIRGDRRQNNHDCLRHNATFWLWLLLYATTSARVRDGGGRSTTITITATDCDCLRLLTIATTTYDCLRHHAKFYIFEYGFQCCRHGTIQRLRRL